MSAFLVWVAVPALVGLGLFVLRRFYLLSVSLGTLFCAGMSLLAWRLPLDTDIQFSRFTFYISSAQDLFGRQFVLEARDRPILVVVYLLACFWFFAVYWIRAGRMLVPLGIVLIALLIAALMVEPFLYAGLLIALAVLVCVPILAPPGSPVRRGVLRFLTSLSLGVPFILFTGWILAGVESRPGDLFLIYRSAGLLALGFVFLLGIFPFHTWVLMLSEDIHPYAAGFVLSVLPWMISLFGLGFLDHYTWLRSDYFLTLLRWAGVAMVAMAGLGAAFEIHLGRIYGFAILTETGLILASAGLPNASALLFELGAPRTVSLAVWALALSVLRSRSKGMNFGSLAGWGRAYPVAAAALILAQFSVAGVPILAGFPLRLTIWNTLASMDIFAALGLVLGSLGMIASGLRVMAVLVTGPQDNPWSITEPREVLTLMALAIFFLLFFGIFPQVLTVPLFNTLQ